MSYCEIIEFKDGKPDNSVEFGNAWGGMARIWTSLFDAHLKDPAKQYDSWLARGLGDSSLWKLAERRDLPLFERAVHASTFDRFIVKREHFAQFAEHLREFAAKYPTTGVRHLTAWADFIAASEAEAIGFYGTSVSENLWHTWDEEAEESIPYDLNSGTEHHEVYEWLSEIDSAVEA